MCTEVAPLTRIHFGYIPDWLNHKRQLFKLARFPHLDLDSADWLDLIYIPHCSDPKLLNIAMKYECLMLEWCRPTGTLLSYYLFFSSSFCPFCLFVLLPFCLFVFLSFCLFVFSSVWCSSDGDQLGHFGLTVSLSFCNFVFLSYCLFAFLSFCLFKCVRLERCGPTGTLWPWAVSEDPIHAVEVLPQQSSNLNSTFKVWFR